MKKPHAPGILMKAAFCRHIGLFRTFTGRRSMVSRQAVTGTLGDGSLPAVIPPISNPLLSRQLQIIRSRGNTGLPVTYFGSEGLSLSIEIINERLPLTADEDEGSEALLDQPAAFIGVISNVRTVGFMEKAVWKKDVQGDSGTPCMRLAAHRKLGPQRGDPAVVV